MLKILLKLKVDKHFTKLLLYALNNFLREHINKTSFDLLIKIVPLIAAAANPGTSWRYNKL